jgi:hypothetical protein
VEWKPADGDILVGSVREMSIDAAGHETVVIEEERTGFPVTVSLESAQLAALFDLHKPRGLDRIGIKYSGLAPNGVARYTMVMDRHEAVSEPAKRRAAGESMISQDEDCSTATSEERDFISNMLTHSQSVPQEETAEPTSGPIEGYLRHQEQEIGRQAKALQRLEALIAQPQEIAPDPKPDPVTPEPKHEKRPKRALNWLRIIALWMALFMASALGALTAVLVKPSLHVWFR